PRRAAGARDVHVTDARGSDLLRGPRPDAASRLLRDHGDRQVFGDLAQKVDDAAEVFVAPRLDDLHRRVQMHAERVGPHARHEPLEGLDAALARLHRADVAEQKDVRSDLANVVSRVTAGGGVEHRALAAETEAVALFV